MAGDNGRRWIGVGCSQLFPLSEPRWAKCIWNHAVRGYGNLDFRFVLPGLFLEATGAGLWEAGQGTRGGVKYLKTHIFLGISYMSV